MYKNLARCSRVTFRSFLVLLLFVFLVPSLLAQTADTGALAGTVTDSTGAVVPNATVTVTNADTGQVRTATTGAAGDYQINTLPPGNYHVKFEASGFQTVEVPAAKVTVTETAVLNQSLQVGAQAQEVTVQANVETIQTASSALGTVVNTETVTELPLNTRNYTNLLAMSAGANASASNASTLGKGSSLIAVNGGGQNQNTYLQDGASINNFYSLGTNVEGTIYASLATPNPDTIAEFKIQTSTYDAGYGRNPGSNVNVITKSGTNQFHGTAFEFFRNTVLNANDFFNGYSELSRGLPNKQPTLNQNQYGGVFGGPVKKDKLFFFVSYQGTGQKNGLSGYGVSNVTLPAIPTIARGSCTTPNWTTLSQCDANTAAFVAALASANCASKPVAAGSTVSVLCAPTAAAPTANINPVAINILQLKYANGNYAVPSVNNGAGGFVSIQDPAIFNDWQGLGNVDYVIDGKNTLSGRYDYEQDPLTGLAVVNATVPGTVLPGIPVNTTKYDQSALLRLTSIVTPNFVNQATVSYQRYVTINSENSPFTDTQVGITPLCTAANLPCGAFGNDLGFFTFTGFSFGAHYFYIVNLPENQFEYSDQISWTHGKHSIRAGFDGERIQVGYTYPSVELGAPTFQSFSDFLVGRPAGSAASGGNGGTASNIQNVGGSTVINGPWPFNFRMADIDGFVQDDFKVSSRLTFNLGLRWEYDGFLNEKHGLFTNFWQTLANAVPFPGSGCAANGKTIGTAGGTGCSLAGYVVPSNFTGSIPAGIFQSTLEGPAPRHAPWDDFAPRVGFAWQPLSSNKWVIRGGGGLFYDLLGGSTVGKPTTSQNPGVGVPSPSSPLATLQVPWVVPATVPGPAGSFGFTPRWINFGANPNSTTAISSSALEPNMVSQFLTVPVTYEWNLNTQYEFLPAWVLELGYVGSHGIHQAGSSYYNAAPLASPTNPLSCGYDGKPADCITADSAQNTFARTPILGLSPADSGTVTGLDYKFNSLQMTVRKQLSHGLQMQAAYTWSRAFISAPYGIDTAPYVINRYGENSVYRPQRLVVNYVWNLPIGSPEGLKGKLVNGWTLSGVTTIQDGTPLTITDSQGGTLFGVPTTLSTAQFCPGMTNASVPTSGSVVQRVLNGLAVNSAGARTGPGYLNGVGGATEPGAAVFCSVPSGSAVNSAFSSSILGTGTGFGNSGPGIVLAPGQDDWDMSLAKMTKVGGIREGANLEFRAEFFNAFNHPQFSLPATGVRSASTYGQITSSTVNPRVVQFALKYSF